MSEPPIEVLPAPPTAAAPAEPAPRMAGPPRWLKVVLIALLLLAAAALAIAWETQQRVSSLQQELVRRQQDSQAQAMEARMLAKQAHDTVREAAAKVALLEQRVAEAALQRTQLEELIQSLSRSRDENLLVDIDAGLRVAMQQTAITGSAEPLVSALKQADDRLARASQPRLEGVRRAVARDMDRVKGVGVADLPSLSIKLDEAVRLVDELPLLSVAEPRKGSPSPATGKPAQRAAAAEPAASASSASAPWTRAWNDTWSAASERVWSEVKSLVRVTRIDHPEAMLLAPEQAFFVRENLKLRLLNARLALLSRQYDTAQSDLQIAQSTLERYFDRSSRRLTLESDLIKQVAMQARHVVVPRPDETLAALAAATAGR